MTELQTILLIIAGALGIYQIACFYAWGRMLGSGKYNRVTVPLWSGVIALALVIAVALL